MADHSIIGSATVDINKIKSKLSEISQQNIKLNINSQDILTAIGNIKTELEGFEKKPYNITLDLAGTAETKIQDLKNQLNDISKQTKKQSRNQARTNKRSGGSSKKLEQSTGFSVSRRKWAQKYRDAANAEEQQVIQSLLGKGSTLISASGKQRYDKTGKEVGANWIVSYRNELGKTVKTMLSYNKAADKWRVTGTDINANYEAQAKAQEKVQNYLDQQENAYKNLESSAFAQKGALDKNSPYGQAALEALQKYQDEYKKIQNDNSLYGRDSRKEVEARRQDAQRVIKEQKALYDAEKKEEARLDKLEADRQKRIENKQKEYDKIATDERKEEQRSADYNSKFLSKQDIGIKDLESKAFNQNNPLTGDFKKTADDAVNYWKSKVDEAKSYSQKLTQDQENQIKEAEAAARRTVLEQQKAQWRGDKLAAKDVGQKVSNASWGLDIQVEELKQAGQYTEEVQNKIKALQDALKGVKDQKGFDEWSKQLQQFNQELELAGEKAKTAFKSESMQLDIENLQTRLNNLKQKYDEFVEANPGKADAGIEESFKRISDAINSIDMNNIDPQKLALLRKEVRNFGADINGIVTPAQSLGQVLSQNLGGIGQYLARFTSAFYVINKSISTIKSMVNEVKSLDTSLMELQKVTTLSGDSLAQFTDNAYKTGKEVGRTGKDVIDAVTTFSRAGYNLQESNELAKAALTMTNVGVDIPNTEAAASDMISILRAFGKEANESMQVIDELYNVANKEPLDFGNITDMLVTAGGTLAQSNTSLEETMGLLTAGYATLRDNSVSNG